MNSSEEATNTKMLRRFNSVRPEDDFSDLPLKGDVDQSSSNAINWFNPVNPYDAPVDRLEWIIYQFAAKGMITILGGVAGSGKSILTQYLLQLRNKQQFIETKSGNAIYLTGMDSSETEIRRRAKSIGKGDGLGTVQIPDTTLPFITNESFYNELKEGITRRNVDVIVFDTLADFHSGNLYEAADANATMAAFRRLAISTNVSIILITHTRKSAEANKSYTVNDIADSRIFGTKSDFVFAIKNEYQDTLNLIELQCLKARSPKPMPPKRATVETDETSGVFRIEETDRPFSAEAESMAQQKKIERRREKAWKLKQEGQSSRQIAEELNVSHTLINRDVREYEKANKDE